MGDGQEAVLGVLGFGGVEDVCAIVVHWSTVSLLVSLHAVALRLVWALALLYSSCMASFTKWKRSDGDRGDR